MALSQKCLYSLRAIFELARRTDKGEDIVQILTIAESQNISSRFLENILRELRPLGILESIRGKNGGYRLVKDISRITVGSIILFVEGSLFPVHEDKEAMDENEPFLDIFEKAHAAMIEKYNSVSIADVLLEHKKKLNIVTNNFVI